MYLPLLKSYSTVHDHELNENFELAGEAGLADSSHVVGLLPHHLLHLHDEEERSNVAGMRASWKALVQVNQ